VFGTRDGSLIDTGVDGFCRSRLGAAQAEVPFRATSVGVEFGATAANSDRNPR